MLFNLKKGVFVPKMKSLMNFVRVFRRNQTNPKTIFSKEKRPTFKNGFGKYRLTPLSLIWGKIEILSPQALTLHSQE